LFLIKQKKKGIGAKLIAKWKILPIPHESAREKAAGPVAA